MVHEVRLRIGEHDLVLETGRMAKQANGAVFGSYGGSAVIATACCSDKPVEGLDYVPLHVEYNEKHYAAGKIPGGFPRREGRPRDKEILVSRLIDRPLRPLFSKEFKRDIQVVPTVISTDIVNPPDIVAMNAASAAVVVSDIPFDGPIGAVRIGMVNGELVVNPTFEEMRESEMDIVVAGTEQGITMVEGGAQMVGEDALIGAIEKAHETIKELCRIQNELRALAGKEKLSLVKEGPVLEKRDEIWNAALPRMEEACFVKGKMERSGAIRAVKTEVFQQFQESIPEDHVRVFDDLIEELETHVVRKSILEKSVRTDGRGLEDIRPITCEVGVLPRTHGSALFTRGETQALAVTTLGTVSDEQLIDDIEGDTRFDPFMLHYNFPPYSVGETGRLGTGRREIGHGHLAKRAVHAVLPSRDEFPYTIRIVSEILESNGSSSMATVCGSSLSLLNTGVPIKKPVAGIAMGLITDGDRYAVLSDILGEEDHLGDMDFKVAGTEDGITAFQMDIKISGVSSEIMAKALDQARRGRLHILSVMNQTVSEPTEGLSEYAPRIITIKIDPEKIGAIIGTGGKNIKALSERTSSDINIEDDGTITIFAKTKQRAEEARRQIRDMTEDPEVGKVYNGTVKRIMDFGAFVEILPGREGLVHISKLARERVNSVEDVLKLGQEIPVKLVEVDKLGRINLSYIDAIDPGGSSPNDGRRPPREGNDRGGDHHGQRRRG
jgi:polyribonucleotide nucleotidyltransferase